MEQTLTKEEIQHLFKVCEDNGVHHYDVQVELVDHLATFIEQYWVENPEDPFKYAVYKAWKKFTPSGFKNVKNAKQQALARKYNRMIWHFLLDFYRWPKIVLTLALALALAFAFQIANSIAWILIPYFLLLVIGGYIYYFKKAKKAYTVKTVPDKKFMLLEQIQKYQLTTVIFCQLPSNFLYIFNEFIDHNVTDNIWAVLLVSLLTVSLNIVLYGFFFYVPKKMKEHFMEQFAEFAV